MKRNLMKLNAIKKNKMLASPRLVSVQDHQEAENKDSGSVGDNLRKVRQEKNLTLKDISNALRIQELYLQAIEVMDQKELPERVYTLGFVRSYAHYLGLDPQTIVNLFKKEFYRNDKDELLSLPEPVIEMSRASWKIIFLCIAVIGAVLLSWYHLSHKKKAPGATLSLSTAVDEKASER